MAPSGDPVRAGYVASLARPGGNITGVSLMSSERSAKLLEVLKDAVPEMSRVAVLWNSANPVKVVDFGEIQRAAPALRLTVSSIEVKALKDFETAFTAIARARPDALLILVDEVLSGETRPRIAEFALKRRVPSIAGNSGYAAAGGLIGYGPGREMNRLAAVFVAKILKGAKPARGVFVVGRTTLFANRVRLAERALKNRIPMMCGFRDEVETGCLMSYEPNLEDLFRRTAGLVDRILKGVKPADLPVEQPTKFELVINLKTAKALGLTIPPSVLGRADQVIE
jgi:ABC-type uncharacterized transport system substrate-binding protein